MTPTAASLIFWQPNGHLQPPMANAEAPASPLRNPLLLELMFMFLLLSVRIRYAYYTKRFTFPPPEAAKP